VGVQLEATQTWPAAHALQLEAPVSLHDTQQQYNEESTNSVLAAMLLALGLTPHRGLVHQQEQHEQQQQPIHWQCHATAPVVPCLARSLLCPL
jgi:hypothetical protein